MNKNYGNITRKVLLAALLLFGGVATAQVQVNGSVFGGGNLANVKGNSSVTITQVGAKVETDVYGGGALADVNVTETVDNGVTTYSPTAGKVTTVDILEGIIGGNVYGGGLGDDTHPAKVYGPVTVNIGELVGGVNNGFAVGTNGNATLNGSVYGCNNAKGTPLDNVTVNIYQTHHTEANTVSGTGYAIYQVFGGGNKAHYEPASNDKKTTVHIWTCDNTIEYLYGGGNAADVGNSTTNSADEVIIDGGRILWVFGGGNGYSATNNHTDPDQPNYNPGANIYGDATVTFRGGDVHYLFGGSNEWGNITGSKTVSLLNDGTCPVDNHIAELYGGNNKAPINNNVGVTLTMPCPTSGSPCKIDYLFGGSREANISGNVVLNVYGGLYDYVFGGNNISGTIDGDVTLNLYGGTINEAAFGGNNEGGAINGKIIVNMLADEDCDLVIHNIYGGGYNACYNPTTAGDYPEVNLIHGTVSKKAVQNGGTTTYTGGNVFGGGYGQTATVQSNPMVRVGYDATMSSYIPTGYPISEAARTATIENIVFGGGDLAAVAGSTNVTLQNANSSVVSLFGGGNQASVGNATVNVIGGVASTGVYGGCNQSGTVGGSITPYTFALDGSTNTYSNTPGTAINYDGTIEVNIKSNLGTTGTPLVEGIYGGGKGSATRTTGNVTVTIEQLNNEATAPIIYADIYGGSALGWVGDGEGNDLTKIDFQNGTLHGVLYGGGMGDGDNSAQVKGHVEVDVTSGSISGGVYGGCNLNGTVTGNIAVNVNGGTIGVEGTPVNVHGGGYGSLTSTSGNVAVNIAQVGATTGPTIWGDVYGGSALGNINTSDNTTTVTINKGTIQGDLYGGGLGNGSHPAAVNGAVQVTANGGTVKGSIYGCNNVNGAPQSTVKVDIYATDPAPTGSTYALANVFGGGNLAPYGGTPDVTIHNCDNSIGYVYGGGNKASVVGTNVVVYGGNTIGYVFAGGNGETMAATYPMVSGNAVANIYGGTINKVFGGNNNSGAINGTISVNVYKQTESGHTACPMIIGEVYGGGNFAAGKAGTITVGCTGAIVDGADGHIANPNNIGVTLEGIGTVYGGANRANITNNIQLDINNGMINKVFGGNNNSGEISGTVQVNINKTGDCWYVGEVYGGGDHAPYSGTPNVNIMAGTVYRNVYGGGNDITADDPNNPSLGVAGSNVEMTGGNVLLGVYGGCNLKGTVTGNSLVKIYGGTVGSSDQLHATTPIVAQVFGGGLGENTRVNGNVEVKVDKLNESGAVAPIIYGDVYGGSALGTVNNDGNDNTTVYILDGILETFVTTENNFPAYIGGNVYGGGLGEAGDANVGKGQVNGKVVVNIGSGTLIEPTDPGDPVFASDTEGNATIKGNIYGCNNTNGSPQQDVVVNVFQTHHTQGVDDIESAGYALHNVFGGGNKANFRVTGKSPYVNIYGCDNTIERTFGGSNAAASNTVNTMIQGGHIHEAYGGGNGEVTPADIYGDVNLNIHGGTVDQSFGGSNQHGTISGQSYVTIDGEGCGGVTEIEEFYCGGNFADYEGNIDATIQCADGLFIHNLYGGCKQADVVPSGEEIGNVHLVVYGGTYDNIFGGSQGRLPGTNGSSDPGESADINGSILLEIYGGKVNNAIFGGSHMLGEVKGTITVNIENGNTGCELDLSETDVYGGGNEADYEAPATAQNYPQVNIRNATVKNVFGGAYKADVKGNPQIKIKRGSKILGNIYGGGNMGEVIGSPKVIVNGEDTTDNPHVFPTIPNP